MSTVREVIYGLPEIFVKEKAKGWDRCIVFELSGDEPGVYTAITKGQELTIHDGEPTEEESAMKSLKVFGDSQYIVQMFTGEVPPMQLVNSKKIQMKGGMIDSMSFSRIWSIKKK